MRVNRVRAAACAVLVFVASMCATVPHHQKRLPRLEELSLDEKIGQLFAVGAHGVFMGESSPAYQQLLHQARDNHVGGIIWFVSNVYETALLNQKLQEASRVPLLISADLEAGIGMRFSDTTFWPSAMAVAATGDPSLAEQEGRVVAREGRALGVNHILAPVADVNVDPDNPVINTRSFGEDPADVSRYVTAFIRGVQSEHVGLRETLSRTRRHARRFSSHASCAHRVARTPGAGRAGSVSRRDRREGRDDHAGSPLRSGTRPDSGGEPHAAAGRKPILRNS